MKKTLSLFIIGILTAGMLTTHSAMGAYNYTPKAPTVTPSLKPIIQKYRNEDYIGSMIDLEELVKKEKNNTFAKYYLALCYTHLGYKQEAEMLYQEIVAKDDNLALTHYSKRAMICLSDPNNYTCHPGKPQPQSVRESDDMETFIRSGVPIHPAAMDKITRERMERKLQEDEYKKRQQASAQAQQQLSSIPTNEEIASALNTLSKLGMNPYTQNNNLANLNLMNSFGQTNNVDLLPIMLQGNTSPEVAKMFLYNQMNQQNNLMNYGI